MNPDLSAGTQIIDIAKVRIYFDFANFFLTFVLATDGAGTEYVRRLRSVSN